MTQKGQNNTAVYLSITFSMICWGLSFVWCKQALVYFTPVSLVFTRLIISFPLLMVTAVLLRRLKKINRQDIKLFLLLAFFEPLMYFLGESFSLLYLSSTVASILIATIPLFTSLAAYFFLKEKLTTSNYSGILISFTGVLFVVFSEKNELAATWKGLLLIMVAVFSAIGYGFIIKKIANKYNSLTIVSVQNFIGALYFLPLFLIFDFKKMLLVNWSLKMFMPALYLAVFASTFAYIGFIQGVRKLGISRASVFTNFIPVFTAVFAFIILNETINFYKIAGILFVVGGLIMAQSTDKITKERPEENIIDELY